MRQNSILIRLSFYTTFVLSNQIPINSSGGKPSDLSQQVELAYE